MILRMVIVSISLRELFQKRFRKIEVIKLNLILDIMNIRQDQKLWSVSFFDQKKNQER